MKRGIHPVYQTCTVTCGCGNAFATRSTKPKIAVEICSHCHPFFTGKQKFVDTAGMVEKFQKKFASASYATVKPVRAKKASRAPTAASPLKGTNFDLALASAPGTPKAPPPVPGKARGGRGWKGATGDEAAAAEAAAGAEAAAKKPAGRKGPGGKGGGPGKGAPPPKPAEAAKPAEASTPSPDKPAAAKPAEAKPAPAAPPADKPAAAKPEATPPV
jgi:large subunit ribosomal protein L31